MIMGTVKFYDRKKGIGLIQPDNGSKDILINSVVLERAGMCDLAAGQKVSYETTRDRRSGKLAANDLEAI